MSIQALSGVDSALSLYDTQNTSSQSGATEMFKDIYDNLIDNVNSTSSAFEGDIVKAAEGELDNPHQLVIDSTKANISLQLMLNVRNSALDAYNDVIKMSV